MKWYFPSWNGDFRLEKSDNEGETIIQMVAPTAGELEKLTEIGKSLKRKGWVQNEVLWTGEVYRDTQQSVTISAPLSQVAPVIKKILRPGKSTLTAVVFKDGKVETVEGSDITPLAAKAEKDGKAAASVKRPTPCCPQCFTDAVAPATEVLLSMCTPEQHEMWARERRLICFGNLSGHRYVIAHRHSPFAAALGKICLDADDGTIFSFHDWSVPPEEEVLATKLILEHREPWLRNEATALTKLPSFEHLHPNKYKNPFGNSLDGVPDSSFTTAFGRGLRMLLES